MHAAEKCPVLPQHRWITTSLQKYARSLYDFICDFDRAPLVGQEKKTRFWLSRDFHPALPSKIVIPPLPPPGDVCMFMSIYISIYLSSYHLRAISFLEASNIERERKKKGNYVTLTANE